MNEEHLPCDKKVLEEKLYKAVAYNLRLAREISGFTPRQAQSAIWNYKDEAMFANRVSEMESGNKKIDLKTFFKACETYNCSADFLLGFSDEFERDNLAAKNAGMVFKSIQGTVLEATEQLCINVSKSITHFPPFQGEMLKTSAKQLIDIFERYSHELASKKEYLDLLQAAYELKTNIAMFEIFFAKQQRQFELSMMSLLEEGDDEEASVKLTKPIEVKKPKSVPR